MDQVETNEMLPEGYPSDVEFSEHYSIFTIGLRHKVNLDRVKGTSSAISDALEKTGWQPHPSVRNIDVTKQFSIFNPQADSAIYGDTPWNKEQTLDKWLKERLQGNRIKILCSH